MSFTVNPYSFSDPLVDEIVFSGTGIVISDTGSVPYFSVGSGGEVFVKLGTVQKKYLNDIDPIGYLQSGTNTITQLTSKSTSVTLNVMSGEIIMHNENLASNSIVSFVLNNSKIGSGNDFDVRPYIKYNPTVTTEGAYRVWTDGSGNNKCNIYLENYSGSNLSEPVIIGFSLYRNSI